MANTKDIRGTRTEKCLVAAYVSESTAYTRYMYYAQQADKEQYFPIGEIFRETAANELHHGKVFFRMLQGGKVDVALNVDAGIIGTTAQNLEIASAEELAEGVEQYKNSAKVADEEGFPEIADHFRAIAAVEESHRRRFDRYLKEVKEGTVWKREKPVKWRCLVCGYIYEGTTPPEKCPGCDHPYKHYLAMDVALD